MDGRTGSALAGKSENVREDRRADALKVKLERLLAEAAQVEVELSRADGTINGVPHYSIIEGRAHELGRALSREVQQQQMNELAAMHAPTACCPGCNTRCEVEPAKREMKTVDGETELQELVAHCPRCRRDFFPDADNTRI